MEAFLVSTDILRTQYIFVSTQNPRVPSTWPTAVGVDIRTVRVDPQPKRTTKSNARRPHATGPNSGRISIAR